MRKIALLMTLAALVFVSCGKEEVKPEPTPDGTVTLNCVKPAYLSAGDTVALISPSYYTPMENVEATADLLRSWGLVPVIGPNVGKVVDGKYAGTVAERFAFPDQSAFGQYFRRHTGLSLSEFRRNLVSEKVDNVTRTRKYVKM